MKNTVSSLKDKNVEKVKDSLNVGMRREEPGSILSESGIALNSKRVYKASLPDDTDRIHQIMRAVVHMDTKLKTPFSMFIGGYNYDEIAQKLNIPVETVKKRIGSAREELQKILAFGDCQRN